MPDRKNSVGDEAVIEEQLKRAAVFTDGWYEALSIEELADLLDSASMKYVSSAREARSGLLLAMNGIIRYLSAELPSLPGDIDRQLLPLIRLARALEGLDSAVVHDILRPSKKGRGAPGRTKDFAEFSLMCCVAVQLKCAGGRDENTVRSEVAKHLKRCGFAKFRRSTVGNVKPIDAQTLANWARDVDLLLDDVAPSHSMSFETYMIRNCLSAYGYRRNPKTPNKSQTAFGDFLLKSVIPTVFGHLRIASMQK